MGLVSDGFLEIADRVWVATYDPCGVNVVVIDGSESRVVVDTRGTAEEGRELRRDLARLPSRPTAAVVNTHAHFDHTFGNVAFPDVSIVGHRRVAEILGDQARMRIRIERLATWYPDPDGLRTTPLVPPDRTFERSTTIDLGDRSVVCSFLGRGHTDHDTVVEVPDASILLTGDLVEQSGPPVFGTDAHPFDWPVTLDRMLGLAASTFVPGHGTTVGTEFVVEQRDALALVAELVGRWCVGEVAEPDLLAASPYDQDTTREAMALAARDPDAPSPDHRA